MKSEMFLEEEEEDVGIVEPEEQGERKPKKEGMNALQIPSTLRVNKQEEREDTEDGNNPDNPEESTQRSITNQDTLHSQESILETIQKEAKHNSYLQHWTSCSASLPFPLRQQLYTQYLLLLSQMELILQLQTYLPLLHQPPSLSPPLLSPSPLSPTSPGVHYLAVRPFLLLLSS